MKTFPDVFDHKGILFYGTTINESQNRMVNADVHSSAFGYTNFYSPLILTK